jgi:hypothetical protein
MRGRDVAAQTFAESRDLVVWMDAGSGVVVPTDRGPATIRWPVGAWPT